MTNIEGYFLRKINLGRGYKPEEAAKLFEFYDKNKHDGNRVRDPINILNALKSGQFFVVENSSGSILAASSTFNYGSIFIEAGGTRVLEEIQGLGIQKLFHHVRIVETAIFEDNYSDYITVVANWNDKSIKNIKKSGFKCWKPKKQDLAVLGKIDASGVEAENVSYYRIPKSDLHKNASDAAKNLMLLYNNPIIKSSHTEKVISLVLDIKILQNDRLKHLVEELI